MVIILNCKVIFSLSAKIQAYQELIYMKRKRLSLEKFDFICTLFSLFPHTLSNIVHFLYCNWYSPLELIIFVVQKSCTRIGIIIRGMREERWIHEKIKQFCFGKFVIHGCNSCCYCPVKLHGRIFNEDFQIG